MFERLLDAIPDAVVITRTDGSIVFLNQQADLLFGWKRSELVGQPIESLLPERYRERHVGHRAAYVESPRVRPMGVGLDLYALHADGRKIPVEISLSPVTLSGELAVISTVRDVSDRKALEQERQRLFEQAQEAVRLRNEFLSAISHDLGNPVAAIRMQSRVLQEGLEDGGEPSTELVEGLEQIEATARRAWSLIEELLDLARLQMGRGLELNWRAMDLADAVRAAVIAQQATTEQHQLRLELEVPEFVGEWDATRIERVIINLLSNAIKYSPSGGEIVVRLREERGGADPRTWAVLEVCDHGIGIPAADLPHIFERFRRASNVVGRFPGTGIGLAGAREIVEHHGGTLTVASREGAGTTVSVRLPREETPPDL